MTGSLAGCLIICGCATGGKHRQKPSAEVLAGTRAPHVASSPESSTDPDSTPESPAVDLVAAWSDEGSTSAATASSGLVQPDAAFTNDHAKRFIALQEDESKSDPSIPRRDPAPSDTGSERLPPLASEGESDLSLEELLASVANSFPILDVLLAELAEAEGKAFSTVGNFDTLLSGHSISAPLGFYQTYRNLARLRQPLWMGGEVYGGYRIGDGNFQPWFGERETNEGGEFKTGFKQPLLQGYAIDNRRAELEIAHLERQRLGPDVQARVIEIQRASTQLYWEWVAAGQVVETRKELLKLAEDRNRNLVARVREGDLPEITEVDNGRFIAKRQANLVKARRKLQKAAIKLSLFYRNEVGQPIVVDDDRLPPEFPTTDNIDPSAVEADIARSLAARPELQELDFQRQQAQVQRCVAQNKVLPKLDAFAVAGQDVGGAASSKRDKSPFELELGVLAEVPIQRREAAGKVRAAEAKLAQIAAKRQFVEDKIRTQVLDAVSALNLASERIERARENLELTQKSVRLGRERFDEGDIDIIELNIYETSLAEAELLLTASNLEYFSALADFRAALAINVFES